MVPLSPPAPMPACAPESWFWACLGRGFQRRPLERCIPARARSVARWGNVGISKMPAAWHVAPRWWRGQRAPLSAKPFHVADPASAQARRRLATKSTETRGRAHAGWAITQTRVPHVAACGEGRCRQGPPANPGTLEGLQLGGVGWRLLLMCLYTRLWPDLTIHLSMLNGFLGVQHWYCFRRKIRNHPFFSVFRGNITLPKLGTF